ncbi:MAG: hypothetical protein HDT32_01680 [Clostridiales bacterium]|nr:hypothetical protein [Clostridiales bacterium]
MKVIDGSNWLYNPWKRMGHNDFYRFYHYRDKDNTYERYLLIVRTSDKCYRCITWKQYFNGYTKSEIVMMSFRSFHHVRAYAKNLIGGE